MNNNNLIGIALSILCIIHCALPFLAIAASLNSLEIFIENSKIIHIFLFALVFLVYLIHLLVVLFHKHPSFLWVSCPTFHHPSLFN